MTAVAIMVNFTYSITCVYLEWVCVWGDGEAILVVH